MPSIVQSGFVRGNNSPLTITLGATPTSGNLLVLIICGFSQTLTVPTSFSLIQIDSGNSHANEGTWTYVAPAAGAGTSFSFTGASDWHNIGLFEVSGAATAPITAYGSCSNVGSSPINTGSLTAQASTSLRFLTLEWDQSTPNPTTPSGWTLLSPSTWITPSTGNHGGAIWSIPPTTSGVQSISFLPTETYSVIWLDVTLILPEIQNSKLVTYEVLSQADVRTSKLVTYEVLSQADVRTSKLVTYEVLSQIGARVSKIVTYLVLGPPAAGYVPSATPPIKARAAKNLNPANAPKPPRRSNFVPLFSSTIGLVESASSTDSLGFALSSILALADSVTSADTLTALINFTENLIESGASADTFSYSVSLTGALVDTGASADTLAYTLATQTALSDAGTLSENLGYSFAATETLSDGAVSGDVLSATLSAYAALSDLTRSSDTFIYPTVLFAGLGRKTLNSGGSGVPVRFGALRKSTLISAGNNPSVQIAFGGLKIKTLVSAVPPSGFGPIPIFPTLPEGYPIKVSSVTDTIVGTTKSLREMRVAQQNYPIWDIEIVFEELRDQTQNQTPYAPFVGYTEYQELLQTWLMMYGQSGVFAFDCPWDNSRANQIIGVGDGETFVFNLYRTWGLGAQATLGPIGMLNQMLSVQVNGVTVSSTNYTLTRNQIIFVNVAQGFALPPAAGKQITATFSYYYLCRFTEDEQDFEEWAKDRWTVTSLKFRAAPWL